MNAPIPSNVSNGASSRDLLIRMLALHAGIERKGETFTPAETVTVEVLLLAGGGGGPVPLSKVERLTLHEDFIAIVSQETTAYLPYAVVVGFRMGSRETARGAGFTR